MAEKIISGDSLQTEFVSKFNAMAEEVNTLKENGGGSGGSTKAIIDVVTLPTNVNQIDTLAMYRVTTVQSLVGGVKNQMPNPSTHLPDMLSGIPITIHHVETLPEAPEYATDDYNAPTKFVFYYLVSGDPLFETNDNRLYAYMPVGKLPATGEEDMANTWQRADTFLTGGYMFTDYFITSEDEIEYTAHNNIYFLANIELYHYRNGWQKVSKGVTEKQVSEMVEASSYNAIIDVDSLPPKEAMYIYKDGVRLTELTLIESEVDTGDLKTGPYSINIVDTLPEPANGVIHWDGSRYTLYYQKSDGRVYTLNATDGVKTWTDFDDSALGYLLAFGILTTNDFIITSTSQAVSPENSNVNAWFLYEAINEKAIYRVGLSLYHYRNGWEQIGGGSGSSGSVSGLSIGKITFTDRPTMWTWLQSNYTKILKTVVSASVTPIPLEFSLTNAAYSNYALASVTFSSWYPSSVSDTGLVYIAMAFIINDSGSAALMEPKVVSLDNAGVGVNTVIPTDLPDEYWSNMSISITIYYIE